MQVDIADINTAVARNYGKVLEVTETSARVECQVGHIWVCDHDILLAGYWCKICAMCFHVPRRLRVLRADSIKEYDYYAEAYKMKCIYGHESVVAENKRTCPMCDVVKNIARVHSHIYVDEKTLIVNEDTKIRAKCRQHGHDATCKACLGNVNGLPGCVNFKTCDQDFYITANIKHPGKAVFSCAYLHMWGRQASLHKTMAIFEIIFDVRFDDPAWDLACEFSGYSSKLKLAYIHVEDQVYANKLNTLKMATKHKITVVTIDESLNKTDMLAAYIVNKLSTAGMMVHSVGPTAPEAVVSWFHSMTKSRRYFKTREF